MTSLCLVPAVKRLVLRLANELAHSGAFRLVYPSLDRRILLEKSYKLSFVEGHASTAYDIFTDYFSFEMQNEVLYFKSKKDTKKDTKSHE
jgi:hypothetical protein